jgi:hypothetical protein
MTAREHKCPARCHVCPMLDGQIMPMCMGTAAMATGHYDRSRCTCATEQQDRRRDIDQIGETVRVLIRRVRELEDQVKDLSRAGVES